VELSAEQIRSYDHNGYVILSGQFIASELFLLRNEAEKAFGAKIDGRVFEDDGTTVRSVNGAHLHSETLRTLCSHPRLLTPAKRLLGDDVYVHQFKINAKRALIGDIWEWHRDFVYWQREDEMPQPHALTAAVFLDDVTDSGGPIIVIPGTQKLGDGQPDPDISRGDSSDPRLPKWHSHTAKHMKYVLQAPLVQQLISDRGVTALTGKAGTVVYFHCNLFHSSNANTSPWDRRVILITYNALKNQIPVQPFSRPEFLAGRDFRALTPLADDVLLAGPQPSTL
jgi:ectoine hydroxylase